MVRIVLYLIRKPPGVLANEMIDLILVSGVFEQPTRVLFLTDGVLQLNAKQDGTLIGRKDTAKALSALPEYEIDQLYAHKASMTKHGLNPDNVSVKVTVIDDQKVKNLIHDADIVLSD